jgi:hypothetical protein
MPRIFNGSRVQESADDESFKFRALSASAVMAFDGQTEFDSFPSNLAFVGKLRFRRDTRIHIAPLDAALEYPRGLENGYRFRQISRKVWVVSFANGHVVREEL